MKSPLDRMASYLDGPLPPNADPLLQEMQKRREAEDKADADARRIRKSIRREEDSFEHWVKMPG